MCMKFLSNAAHFCIRGGTLLFFIGATMKILWACVLVLLVTGCSNHPLDCALGTPRADCLPGTNGYAEHQRRVDNIEALRAAKNANDDAKCRSYGVSPGSDAYVNCRVQLDK